MTTADGSIVGTTKIIDNGPASERWNIVIMGDGYKAAQLGQYATDVQGIVGTILATAPFDALQKGINVFRIDVSSTDSGAADPVACGGTGAAPKTFFDSKFCGDGQIRRLLVTNNQTALATAAAQVPQFHLALVLVNSVIYGGSGGAVAVLSLAAGVAEVALHEIGHSAFGLADEYEYWAGCGVDAPGTHDHHPAGEPAQPNVTLNSNRVTNKWRQLVLPATAMPTTSNPNCANCDTQASPVPAGTVGAFEGAHYYHCGAFRPEFHCRMRALGSPFCAVCQDVIKRTLAPFMPKQLRMVVGNYGYDAGGWRVERHPRFMADTSADGRADIVGFGNAGVWVSRAQADGSFTAPQMVVGNFGYDAGGWRVERHPRFMADTTADGRADIVGFGNAGVWVSRAQANGLFAPPQMVVGNFGYDAGGWRVERHPRFMADTTGDGRADIVGFGNAGVWVSRAQGNGFTAPQLVVGNFGYDAGGWRVERHPRFMADTTGDGRADIVGFGNAGVWVSRAQANGTLSAPEMVVANFGYDAGGWRVDRHPRFLADTTGDGRADIVGFGNAGVWVSRAQANGTFSAPELVVANFGYDAGGWRVERHPRFMADTTGDGRADIVGFGNAGVWVSRAQANGSFAAPELVVGNFGYDAGGWRVERHPRFMADITGDARADIVGFGNAGVWTFVS